MDSDHIEFMIDRATEKLEDRLCDAQAIINQKQATIDALVAALEYARGELVDRNGATMSFAKIDAALATARKGG